MDLAREGRSHQRPAMVMEEEKSAMAYRSSHDSIRAKRSSCQKLKELKACRSGRNSNRKKTSPRLVHETARHEARSTASPEVWRPLLEVGDGASKAMLKDAFERQVLRSWQPTAARLAELAAALEGLLQLGPEELSEASPESRPSLSRPGGENNNVGKRTQCTFQLATTAESCPVARLCSLLRTLDPTRRRNIISTELTQQQRLALETWMMLQKKSIQPTESLATVAVPLGRTARGGVYIWKGTGYGAYIACIHLGLGIYAQSRVQCNAGEAVRLLSDMILLRLECRAGGNTSLPDSIARAVKSLSLQGELEADCIGFRSRFSLGKGLKLSTPMRSDIHQALQDWNALMQSAKGASLRSSMQPSALSATMKLKREVQRAWMSIWECKGRSSTCAEAIAVEHALEQQELDCKMEQKVLKQIKQLLAESDAWSQLTSETAKASRRRLHLTAG
mmetsp:Transcript_59653/g.141947  ORF Transcript_59653/g.141947 Transcript_59653/m.141947 type:complete len:450 (-) Transcript_59653:232-1581(-)